MVTEKRRGRTMAQRMTSLAGFVLGFGLLLVAPASAEDAATPTAAPAKAPKHHILKATPETVDWGWLDPKQPPRLTIASGDIVSIETLMHGRDKIQKGTTMDEIVALRKANPGGGPHSMSGPIYVEGAEPGDVMEIKILKIVPKKVGTNFNLPGKDFPTIGVLASQFPEGHVHYFDLDLKKMQTRFNADIVIPLRPFPGTLAVGIDPDDPSPRKGGSKDPMAPVSTLRPWKNGSNMDINEMTAGSTVFIPIFLKGGLIWTGDSHCAQGNGEVNLTALECSYDDIEIQATVRKDLKLTWPRIETPTAYVMVGFDESLDKAMAMAVAETVDFLVKQKGLDPYEAYSLVAVAGDCRVSQVVDVRKGVHCMIPKSLFVKAK
jgi:acetamidase/formamidase